MPIHHINICQSADTCSTVTVMLIGVCKDKYIDMVLNKQQLSAPGGKTSEKESVLKKLEEAKAAQTTKKTETKNHTQEL